MVSVSALRFQFPLYLGVEDSMSILSALWALIEILDIWCRWVERYQEGNIAFPAKE